MRYFVHYTALRPVGKLGTKFDRLVAGPYTIDEALAKRRELDNGTAMNVHIEEEIE